MDKAKIAGELVKLAKELTAGEKVYNLQNGIGKTKYAVNYHDGVKAHRDGSPFYDIALFSNKEALAAFLKTLKQSGYRVVA